MVKEATEQSLVTDMMSDSDNETTEKQGLSKICVSIPLISYEIMAARYIHVLTCTHLVGFGSRIN